MNDSDLVQILNPCQKLSEKLTGFCFFELLPLDDVVKELAVRDILHDEKELLGGFDDLV
jgi:hypothetical protein